MNYLIKYGATERYFNEAKLFPKFILARVISQYKDLYKIVTDDGECFAEISGKFRYETKALRDFPAVGDFVMVCPAADTGHSIIQNILTRKSVFERPLSDDLREMQVIAANIDTVFICMSLNNNYNLSRLERYLSVVWDSGARPVVLLTKTDLCEKIEEVLSEVHKVALDADIIAVSAFDNAAVEKVRDSLAEGKTAAFIGSSGVGKSTLINKLLGVETLVTYEIGYEDKGRHTTTKREMFLLSSGAIVIDNPGMRGIGMESADVEQAFSDIESLIARCKYSDCTHTNESGCAVREAINNGELTERRFNNYLKIKREAKYIGMSAKKRENEKLNGMFAEFGGLKKIKQFKKTLKR